MGALSVYDLRDDFRSRSRHDAELEAELQLLGCILCDGDALKEAVNVAVDHFSDPVHARIFGAVQAMAATRPMVTLLEVADALRGDAAVAQMGGIRFLSELVDKAPALNQTRMLAERVVEAWARRELSSLAAQAARDALEGKPASDMITALRTAVERLEMQAAPEPTHFISARDAAAATLEEIGAEISAGRMKGAQTGLNCFDRRLGGLPPGWLITIGARPSMGKTALVRSAFYGAAQHQPHKLFALFTIEMGWREMSERALSATTADDDGDQVTTETLNRSKATLMDLRRLEDRVPFIPDNLMLDDRSDLSIEDVRRAVWALKRRGDLAAIGIDYLQLMRRPAMQGRNEASVIGEMTQALKRLAREAGICVVLLSQLSRQLESRDDKRPQLSDLRESGSIEQDSNAVMFPFREAYYLERAEPKEGETAKHLEWEIKLADVRRRMDVNIAKCRQGSVGTEKQLYDPEYDRIQNWWDR